MEKKKRLLLRLLLLLLLLLLVSPLYRYVQHKDQGYGKVVQPIPKLKCYTQTIRAAHAYACAHARQSITET